VDATRAGALLTAMLLAVTTNLQPALAQGAPLVQPQPADNRSVTPLTEQRAVADLRSAGVSLPTVTAAPRGAAIAPQDFALLLVRALGIRRTTQSPAAASLTTIPSDALATMRALGYTAETPSLQSPSSAVSREDAAIAVLAVAASKGAVPGGPQQTVFPPFADDTAFSSAVGRASAHLAVALGLMTVGPDNRFMPASALTLGQASLAIDAVRIAAQQRAD